MRKLNLLSMCFVLMVMLSCNHKPKASVTEVNADSLSETIKIAAPSSNTRTFVNRKDSGDLVVFTPIYNTVDLVCGKRPSKDTDMSVSYCAEAAFTGECLDSFAHRNVAGNHGLVVFFIEATWLKRIRGLLFGIKANGSSCMIVTLVNLGKRKSIEVWALDRI